MPFRICIVAALFSTSVVAAPYAPVTLTSEAARADIALARRALETIHPGLYRYRSKAEIDVAFARLEAQVATPITELAMHRALALMLAEIRCDHSKPELSDALTAYRRTSATHLPVRFVIVEGRMIVAATDGQVGAPPRGAEIVTIAGRTVPAVLSALAGAVAYDGTTDQAVAIKLASDSDLSGDDFNEYYPAFYGFPERWDLTWKMPGEATPVAVSLKPIAFDAWTTMAAPFGPQRNEFYRSVGFRLAGKTAVLKIDTFVNYRNPVDTDAFLGGFFKSLKTAGTEHLILDLRNNGGGSEDVSVSLGKYLFDKPFKWGKPARLKAIRYGDLPDNIESWGDRTALFAPPETAFTRDGIWWDRKPEADEIATTEQTPVAADRFGGRLTVLTGPVNASGATRTVAQLKEKRNATLVGEDTSGSAEGPTAGRIFLLTLPNSKLKIRIPNAWNRTNIASWVPGKGVAADRLVGATLADFASGYDRVLDAARSPKPPLSPSEWPNALGKAFVGTWSGTLDYRDYGNDGRVVLPTRLAATPQADGIALAWTYDDGPGKVVRSTATWAIDAVRRTITMESGKSRSTHRLVEVEATGPDGSFTLVAEGTGTENGAAVLVRTVVTRRGNTLSIGRQSRTPGKPYLMRDAYLLKPTG